MEPPKTICTDPTNPQTPFEKEMIESADHAGQHLEEGYNLCIECGLNASRAKSQGLLLACTRMLAYHIMQHTANQGLPADALEYEIANVTTNLRSIFDESYESALAFVIEHAAKGETKQ